MPQVSVLLPVRDAAATLLSALRSLGAQSLEDHEVIAVDDGSTDGSAELLLAAAREDPRVRVERAASPGLVPALNHALHLASAPLVARMDADDVARPERLALQVERLEDDAALGVLGSRVELLPSPGLACDGMVAYVAWQNELLDHEAIVADLFVESPFVHPSVALRRDALVALGGWRDTGGPEDYDLWLRAHAAGWRFGKRPEVLLLWRDRADRLTRRDPRYAAARFLERKLQALLGGPLAGPQPVVVWGAGKLGKAWARALGAAQRPAQALVEVDPRKLGQRIHGAPVVPVSEAARWPDAWHLSAVGQPGARARIRAEARALGIPARRVIAVA